MNKSLEAPKRRGEWVELQFMARAHAHGLIVSKPWGDSARYDFIVESPRTPCHPDRGRTPERKDPGPDRSLDAAKRYSLDHPETQNQERVARSGSPARAGFARGGVARFLRVQVKSTMQTAKHKNGPPGAYLCNTISRGGRAGKIRTYSPEDVDFFALFVIPLDLWYIISLADLPRGTYAVLLDSTRPGNKYFRYLEAWHLLR